jgi:hypothetical protein
LAGREFLQEKPENVAASAGRIFDGALEVWPVGTVWGAKGVAVAVNAVDEDDDAGAEVWVQMETRKSGVSAAEIPLIFISCLIYTFMLRYHSLDD